MPLTNDDAAALVDLLESTAREFAPEEALDFALSVRDELAAYRESVEPRGINELAGFRIPRDYADRAELYLVFEAFHRGFIDPLRTAMDGVAAMLELSHGEVSEIVVARFGEIDRADESVSLGDLTALSREFELLESYSTRIGREIFGEQFDPREFMAEDAT